MAGVMSNQLANAAIVEDAEKSSIHRIVEKMRAKCCREVGFCRHGGLWHAEFQLPLLGRDGKEIDKEAEAIWRFHNSTPP